MKPTCSCQNWYKRLLLSLATGLFFAVTIPAPAQPKPDQPDGPPGAGRRMLRPQQGNQPGGPGQGLPMMEQLLTEDQRDSMRQAMEAQREKLRGLQEKIRAARKALMTAALEDDFKEDAVRAKALEVAKLEADVSVLRLKALAEVQPALSKEQLEKMLNPPPPQGKRPGEDGVGPNNRRQDRPPGGDDAGEGRPPRPRQRDLQ